MLIAYPELQSLLQRLQELPLPQGMSVVDGLRQLLELGEEDAQAMDEALNEDDQPHVV